jgi:osmotically inducible protein OsmC
MALSEFLEGAGYRPERIHTRASFQLDHVGGGFSITAIELDTEARVPNMDEATFMIHARKAKAECPVSRALAVPSITLKARLIS